MNPISAFLGQNMIAIFFVYGLAFFAMGLALALASRRASEFAFVQAIRPLAAFGILHGLHEWIEMFQQIAAQTNGYRPSLLHEGLRVAILSLSFLMLVTFGVLLVRAETSRGWRNYLPGLGLAGLGGLIGWAAGLALKPSPAEWVSLADVLARYSLGIPGALLGAWALMVQQRTFREHGMPQFGRDLVWCATALCLYGAIGQLFVRQTALWPSSVINNLLFLDWFGIPIQLFRGGMAVILAVYMVRALNAFELESQRRLAQANQAKLMAQAAALEAERRISQEMEGLNEALRLTAHELALLLDLSNMLAAPLSLPAQLHQVLQKIVQSLGFPEAGLILLLRRETRSLQVRTAIGFDQMAGSESAGSAYQAACQLGEQGVAKGVAMCRHQDGRVIEFLPEVGQQQQKCRSYVSPMVMLSLPLVAQHQVIGSLVLGRTHLTEEKSLSTDEFKLMLGIAQQLGLSLENARLYQEARERESMLGELLHQAVGAQETERQRIARELHDATGQSLTAIALGLRGVESMLSRDPTVAGEQIKELGSFSSHALGELRRIIADLRPSQLDDLGLVAALQWYIQEFKKRYGLQTELVMTGERRRLPAEYETVLFRIIQEALTNVARHAQATQVTVKLEIYSAQVWVTIQDDGCGFEPKKVLHNNRPPTGWGLLGMQERTLLLGGQCEIASELGRGTRIQIKVPLVLETDHVQDTPVVG